MTRASTFIVPSHGAGTHGLHDAVHLGERSLVRLLGRRINGNDIDTALVRPVLPRKQRLHRCPKRAGRVLSTARVMESVELQHITSHHIGSLRASGNVPRFLLVWFRGGVVGWAFCSSHACM
jgi:hypothetical protein